MSTPAEVKPKTLRVTRTVFDIVEFDDVLLAKDVPFEPADSVETVLAKFENSKAKLLAIINKGLEAEVRNAAYNDLSGFHTLEDEAKGPNSDLNGPYEGTPADKSKVNQLKMTLAKTIYGLAPNDSKEVKKAKKEKAMDFIRTNQDMRDGLANNMAPETESEGSNAE